MSKEILHIWGSSPAPRVIVCKPEAGAPCVAGAAASAILLMFRGELLRCFSKLSKSCYDLRTPEGLVFAKDWMWCWRLGRRCAVDRSVGSGGSQSKTQAYVRTTFFLSRCGIIEVLCRSPSSEEFRQRPEPEAGKSRFSIRHTLFCPNSYTLFQR